MPYKEFFTNYVNHRGIAFFVNENGMGVDLVNKDLLTSYPVMNFTPKFIKSQSDHNGFVIEKSFLLEPVLEYFDFPDKITSKDLRRLRKFLTSKRQIRSLAWPCSYFRINTLKTSVIDYEQEVKLSSSEYYKYVDKYVYNQNIDTQRYKFYGEAAINNPVICPATIFEMLVDNLNSGYEPINGESMVKKTRG